MPAPSCPTLRKKHRNRMVNLPVYFEQRLVGRIDVDRNGPGFTYDPDWIALRGSFPISITMPSKADRIPSDIFLPWAANLLPESEQLRTLGQLLGLSRSDVIGLLSQIGGDTAGALSIGQTGRTATVQWRSIENPANLEGTHRGAAEQAIPRRRGRSVNVPRGCTDQACGCR